MLISQDRRQRYGFAHAQGRQLAAFIVILAIAGVLAFLVHGQKARVDHGGAGGAEAVLRPGRQVHGNGVEGGMDHLAGDRALPDQFVQTRAIAIEVGRHRFGRAQG